MPGLNVFVFAFRNECDQKIAELNKRLRLEYDNRMKNMRQEVSTEREGNRTNSGVRFIIKLCYGNPYVIYLCSC